MSSSSIIDAPRKRLLSIGEDVAGPPLRKRPRLASISKDFRIQLTAGSPSLNASFERLPRARPLHRNDFDFFSTSYAPSISCCSSYTSRACTPLSIDDDSNFISRDGMALMRSVSSASLNSAASVPSYPESSAKFHLRNTKITIDFSTPSCDDPAVITSLLTCSSQNVLYFSRGNRVHYKNLTTSEDVGQLCKLQDSHGDLRIIECSGIDKSEVLAIGTSRGIIQLWDLTTKKKTASWSSPSVTAMSWNGPILTIGSLKGTIRHFDTRISPKEKMKEQVRKVTRHQAKITSLKWNVDGKILASGDQSGVVYCWDSREKVPLDVGEFIQRRKKMQHFGLVSALAWCPWQPKLLASGDIEGTVRLWNINATFPHSNATTPGKLNLEAPVTSLHWSAHCKELLSTHGMKPVVTTSTNGGNTLSQPLGVNSIEWPRKGKPNCVAVHSYPSLRSVTTLSTDEKPVGSSLLNSNGTKLILTSPMDNKIVVCDVWAKRKEIKRQPSFFNSTIR